jgi:hypothetical protein
VEVRPWDAAEDDLWRAERVAGDPDPDDPLLPLTDW